MLGVHQGTDKALGRLSNASLRQAKKNAHDYFDQIARTSKINSIWQRYLPQTSNREKAYIWLSLQLKIPRDKCHIGMFDIADCQKVIQICLPHIT